jgi:hypothetical protein
MNLYEPILKKFAKNTASASGVFGGMLEGFPAPIELGATLTGFYLFTLVIEWAKTKIPDLFSGCAESVEDAVLLWIRGNGFGDKTVGANGESDKLSGMIEMATTFFSNLIDPAEPEEKEVQEEVDYGNE